VDSGTFKLGLKVGDDIVPVEGSIFSLNEGVATVTVRLPDGISVGSLLQYEACIEDSTMLAPFVNNFSVAIKSEASVNGGGSQPRKPKDPSSNGEDVSAPSGITIPKPHRVKASGYDAIGFTKESALKVVADDQIDAVTGKPATRYDFYVNVDNIHLETYQKSNGKTSEKVSIAETKFCVGLMLLGMAMLNDSMRHSPEHGSDLKDDPSEDIYSAIESVSRGFAPFLLPMIDALGGDAVAELEEALAESEES